ncbi:MAG: HDOD domain-containing protein [Pseudomonadota bacterium]|jgi:HD-like signal output (HDOD) protein|nr:HDOD domain-containing protein [Pseudomonadota bacterium]
MAGNVIENTQLEIEGLIERDELVLPTLPEIALKVRDIAEDENASIQDLSRVLVKDPAMSARLLRVVNSPMVRSAVPITDISTAISRMGIDFTTNLVVSIAMEQMFQATNEVIDKRMRACWSHATEIAASAQVLARHFTSLPPDQALLAGLVHQIGTLPILAYAEQSGSLLQDAKTLDHAIRALHQPLGEKVLSSWDFPDDIINVTRDYLNFDRTPDVADLTDLIQVATLQSHAGTSHPLAEIDTATVGAFVRLGLAADTETLELEVIAEEQAETQAALLPSM